MQFRQTILHGRIAPTPSGYLHKGNGFNFVLTWLLARKSGGTLRLRIDDIDAPRAPAAYIQDIFDTLSWLRLDWDKGPVSTADHLSHYSQQNRTADYASFTEKLHASGSAFACTCSRNNSPGSCSCREYNLPYQEGVTSMRIVTVPGVIPAFRELDRPGASIDLHDVMKDFVIRRKDGIYAYQLASVTDDLLYGINFIVRGEDLLPSTAAQAFLAATAGETHFADIFFYHHSLIKNERGDKLSKSAGSLALKSMRQQDPEAILFYHDFSKWLGLSDAKTSPEEFLMLSYEDLLPSSLID